MDQVHYDQQVQQYYDWTNYYWGVALAWANADYWVNPISGEKNWDVDLGNTTWTVHTYSDWSNGIKAAQYGYDTMTRVMNEFVDTAWVC